MTMTRRELDLQAAERAEAKAKFYQAKGEAEGKSHYLKLAKNYAAGAARLRAEAGEGQVKA